MSVITISPEAALNPKFIEKTIMKKMDPLLYFKDLFPVVDLKGATTFKFYVDDESAEDEIQAGKMQRPVTVTELGDLSKVKITPISKKLGDTYMFGLSMEFSQEVLDNQEYSDEVLRAVDRYSYAMARKINLDHIDTMLDYASAPSVDLKDGSWDTSSAIDEDIITMQESLDQEGYDYELTDFYVPKQQYYQTKRFYNSLDGKFNPSDVEGSGMTNVKSNLKKGGLLAMDKKIQPLTTYKNINKKYSVDPKNSLVNVNRYTQEKWPYKEIVDIWSHMGIAVKHPRAILYQTGL